MSFTNPESTIFFFTKFYVSFFLISIEIFYLPTVEKQNKENFVKKFLDSSGIVKTCDELNLCVIESQ
jgi:hypothetical protein